MQARSPSESPERSLEATSDFVTRLDNANSEAEIVAEVMRQVSGYGASSFIAVVIPRQGMRAADSRCILLNSWPADWLKRYIALNYSEHDPIRRCIRESHRPFLWSEIAPQYLEHPLSRRIVAEAATFGLKEGFALALPSLDGNLIGFAIAGESLKVDARKRHELRIIATYAVGRALRLRNMVQLQPAINVTLREREAVQLAASGLNEREIGARMGISGHGVDKHLRSVREKVQARNTAQAIAELLRLRLIT
ncbi:MAG: autoinducer-binding protein [Bradyrhizobium sp. PARBB1]|jgi:LuxR family transcriptional regulator, quorum-sensing system regulator BjaR1|nr:MAG: hypothetical protein C207_04341 [Bradyrhizobium sp. DFCI-1]OYU62807.1 MAG: autoinducer-binding protein [Bradyrhizobium sp. PARBB1]PSO22194.1 autoinducer-binding protein [Bradyrhizobium sp. MOS004]HAQ81005.1 autoinducer-binding protein [Bradyrhizobium sp.]HAR18872.1 autoinducer-binding protein [Bradyrhizobium sp.]